MQRIASWFLTLWILCVCTIKSTTAEAFLTPLSDEQLSQVSVDLIRAAPGMYLNGLTQSLYDYQNGQVGEDQIKKRLENFAAIFGLRLEDVEISGITYGDVKITVIDKTGAQFSILIPQTINRIFIGAIRVNGSSPYNKSFGSFELRNIDLSGTKITIQLR